MLHTASVSESLGLPGMSDIDLFHKIEELRRLDK
jgi:hypothetical protein